MHKKGDLSLSITAIVVIVIAFVVLGLGLTLTRTIFREAEKKLPEAISVIDFETKPTADNTITLPQTLEIGANKDEAIKIGFYNSKSSQVLSATVKIIACVSSDSGHEVAHEHLPSVAAIAQDIKANAAGGYSIIITEKGLESGKTYICQLAVLDSSAPDPPLPAQVYDVKQFFFKVTS